MAIDLAASGKRICLTIAGEHYYLLGFRTSDGGIDFTVTVPDENKATGQRLRETAELLCAACSQLSRMI